LYRSSVLSVLRALVMVMEEFGKLLAQAFVGCFLMPDHHRVLEQFLLNVLRQISPSLDRGGAEQPRQMDLCVAASLIEHGKPPAIRSSQSSPESSSRVATPSAYSCRRAGAGRADFGR